MIGRTTQGGYISIMQHNIRKLSAQLQTLSVQAGSGLSITRPSDAPADMAALMKLREALSDQDVWGANANLGMTLMNVADSALDAANNTLDSTLETAVAMASETYNADDRAEAADEIRALKEQLVALSNTEYSGRYIFAGTDYGGPAYDEAGNYLGSSTEPTVVIDANSSESTGFDGSQIFGDAMAVMDDLIAALEADDPTGISEMTDDIQSALDTVSLWRQRVGHRFNRFDDALVMTENMSANLTVRLEDVAGIDETEVYTRLAQVQTAYEAALQVTSNGMNTNMFDFI
jgi:flagellar hook-associated protein 3 FlgL